jgi:alpha-beta hydrolase superfamily lysophospholipase
VLKSGDAIKVPMLMLCGSNDPVASTAASRAYFETVGSSNKTFKEYPGMLHEPLNEIGREEVWRDITSWISAQL